MIDLLFTSTTSAVTAPAFAMSLDQGVLLRLLFLTLVTAAVLLAARSAHGGGWPTTHNALLWNPSPSWLQTALCIHRHESVDWHRAGVDWTGRRSPYYGGFQFLISTWRSAGGQGLPSSWSPREQLYRAYLVWSRDGRSWSEWGSRSLCNA